MSAAPRIAVQTLLVLASAVPFALVAPGVIRAHGAHQDRQAAAAAAVDAAPVPDGFVVRPSSFAIAPVVLPTPVPVALRPPAPAATPVAPAPTSAACPTAHRLLPTSTFPDPLVNPCSAR